MGLTNKAAARVMDHIRAGTSITLTAPMQLALFGTNAPGPPPPGVDPGETPPDGGATVTGEIRGNNTTVAGTPAGSYARASITFGTAATVADPSQYANTAVISFPAATADWADGATLWVNGFVTYDSHATPASRIGWWHGAFSSGKPVLNGDTASLAIGALVLTLD